MSREYPFIVLFKIISTFDYKEGTIKFSSTIPKRITINEICNIIGVKTNDFKKVLEVLEPLGLVKENRINKSERYLDISQKLIRGIENGNLIRTSLRDMVDIPKKEEMRKIKKAIKNRNNYDKFS